MPSGATAIPVSERATVVVAATVRAQRGRGVRHVQHRFIGREGQAVRFFDFGGGRMQHAAGGVEAEDVVGRLFRFGARPTESVDDPAAPPKDDDAAKKVDAPQDATKEGPDSGSKDKPHDPV